MMLFFPFFYALFFFKAYATKVNYAHHLCSFFLDMPPSMLRFGGGIDCAPNAFLCYHIMLVFGGNTSPMLNKVIK